MSSDNLVGAIMEPAWETPGVYMLRLSWEYFRMLSKLENPPRSLVWRLNAEQTGKPYLWVGPSIVYLFPCREKGVFQLEFAEERKV